MNTEKPFEDMSWVIPAKIAIGNHMAARDRQLLRSMRIMSVLGLTEALRGVEPADIGVRVIEVMPLRDEAGNDFRLFLRALDTLAELVATAAPVLVHCHAGRSRSPVVVAGHLMRTLGIGASEALSQIAARRDICVTPGLEQLLACLE